MTPAPYAWRSKGFANVFIVIGTEVIHATPKTLAKYGLTTADIVDDDHAQTLKSMLHKAGLTEADLVK